MVSSVAALVQEPLDRAELEQSIADLLQHAETRIFLDTSVLIWLYRLHSAARREIIDWMSIGPKAGAIHIPRRALHEFSRHRRDQNVLLPFRQKLAGVPNLLRQAVSWAHLVTDDARAARYGFPSRLAYLGEISDFSNEIERLLKPITAETQIEALDSELTPVFNALTLNGDIYSDMAYLQGEYLARAEARMPPGFKDLRKGKGVPQPLTDESEADPESDWAGANRLGDFLIWSEILDFCESLDDVKGVVLLTHDQKPDWSYTPLKIVDDAGRTTSNPKGALRVTVRHPLLAQEAKIRADVDSVHLVTVPQLAWIVSSKGIPWSFTQLSRAVQVEVEAEVEAEAEEAQSLEVDLRDIATPVVDTQVASIERSAEASPEAQSEASETKEDGALLAFLSDTPEAAIADRLYKRDSGGEAAMDEAIAGLKSHSWYTQNPAAENGIRLLASGGKVSLLQGFVFGRNVYQAACGTAGTPIAILENLETRLAHASDDLANAVYAGMLFEAYFNKDGDLRERPKGEQISSLLGSQDVDRFQPAVQWINRRLQPHVNNFIILPAAERPLVHLALVREDDGELAAIKLGEMSLTEHHTDDPGAEPLPLRITLERLRALISRHFALPENQFLLKPSYAGTLETGDLQLIGWGPRSNVVFPSANEQPKL